MNSEGYDGEGYDDDFGCDPYCKICNPELIIDMEDDLFNQLEEDGIGGA